METTTKHNFGAGPCILQVSVMQQAANAVINWNDNAKPDGNWYKEPCSGHREINLFGPKVLWLIII